MQDDPRWRESGAPTPDGERICFHNPSGTSAETQRAVWMDAERFAGFYAGRGIAVGLPRSS